MMSSLEIVRCDGPGQPSRRERFSLDLPAGTTVAGALRYLETQPRNADGNGTSPVAWTACAGGGPCGACTLLVDGEPRSACGTRLVRSGQPMVLAPLAGFPLVRDLVVDRSELGASLARFQAWVDLDGWMDGPPPMRVSAETAQQLQALGTCTRCGACVEVCPAMGGRSGYAGAHVMHQLRLLGRHPLGGLQANTRLRLAAGPGGLADCANAQNCAHACPQDLPLVDSLAELNGRVQRRVLADWLGR